MRLESKAQSGPNLFSVPLIAFFLLSLGSCFCAFRVLANPLFSEFGMDTRSIGLAQAALGADTFAYRVASNPAALYEYPDVAYALDAYRAQWQLSTTWDRQPARQDSSAQGVLFGVTVPLLRHRLAWGVVSNFPDQKKDAHSDREDEWRFLRFHSSANRPFLYTGFGLRLGYGIAFGFGSMIRRPPWERGEQQGLPIAFGGQSEFLPYAGLQGTWSLTDLTRIVVGATFFEQDKIGSAVQEGAQRSPLSDRDDPWLVYFSPRRLVWGVSLRSPMVHLSVGGGREYWSRYHGQARFTDTKAMRTGVEFRIRSETATEYAVRLGVQHSQGAVPAYAQQRVLDPDRITLALGAGVFLPVQEWLFQVPVTANIAWQTSWLQSRYYDLSSGEEPNSGAVVARAGGRTAMAAISIGVEL